MSSKYTFTDDSNELRKKLTRMKIIATSLLVFMTIIFIIFKRYEGRGLVFSSIVAFAEASMVGALADWFAVVALFRYPMGLKFIPHTAIILNNKNRIASALSNFVVSNFFTAQNIRAKLEKMSVSSKIATYLEQNNDQVSNAIAQRMPDILEIVIPDNKLIDITEKLVQEKLESIKLYPTLSGVLEQVTHSGYHVTFVKEILSSISEYISNNKEKTITIIGDINKALALPFIGDLVHKKILEFLSRQINEMGKDPSVEVNRLLNNVLPKVFSDMKSSDEVINKGELLKADIMESEAYRDVLKMLEQYVVSIKHNYLQEEQFIKDKAHYIINSLINTVKSDNEIRQKLDTIINNAVVGIVESYGEKVGSLIYDTMDKWQADDMVQKLEIQVGADLQYIRINGTVIGGLAGLIIHLISYWL